MTIGGYDNFDVLWKVLGKPESNIALFAIGPVEKIVNPLENQYNLVVDGINILERLILNPLVAHIKPIGKIFPYLLFMELNLLADVQLLPQLDQYAIDGIKVVAIVAACCGEMKDRQIPGILI